MAGRHAKERRGHRAYAGLGRAALAAALALGVLTGAGGTGASWAAQELRSPGSVRSGGVDIGSASGSVQLHSRQPVGSRTYASGTSCTPDAGYLECRVITSTTAQEALIPGDRLVVAGQVSLSARGTNLAGTFTVDPGRLTSSTLSAFSGTAQTTTTVTAPGGATSSGTGAVTLPVSVRDGRGLGTYSVRTVITTPPDNAGTSWGTALQGQQLFSGAYTYTFTQS